MSKYKISVVVDTEDAIESVKKLTLHIKNLVEAIELLESKGVVKKINDIDHVLESIRESSQIFLTPDSIPLSTRRSLSQDKWETYLHR